MEEIIVIIIQVLFEFIVNIILNVLAYSPFDVRTYGKHARETMDGELGFLLFLAGALMGALSLKIIGYHIIQNSALRILGLLLLPYITAKIFHAVAWFFARSKEGIVPDDHFWRAFWFTLGLTLVRFAFGGKWGAHCEMDTSFWLTCHHL
jgi:hypothetical protein